MPHRLIPSCLFPLICFKMGPHAKLEHAGETHFHMNCLAQRFLLAQRQKLLMKSWLPNNSWAITSWVGS